METITETIKKDAVEKTPLNPEFQRGNTSTIDTLLEWWKKKPNCHVNMRAVNPTKENPELDKEPILMYHNTPVIWLEYRAGSWYGFKHCLDKFVIFKHDEKFKRVHNINEQKDMIKHYIDPKVKQIDEKNAKKDKKTTSKKQQQEN